MERKEAQSLGDLLRREIEENRDAFRFDEINAIKAWPVVIGAEIASRTMRPMMRKGVMTIRVASAPLRHELNMMRSRIAEAINNHTGTETVKELRFIG